MNKLVIIAALFACATYASICHSWGDPHNQLLTGQGYNMYGHQGDFTFFNWGKDFIVQERVQDSATWRTNSLLIGAAVRFGRNVFELQNNNVLLNGAKATPAALTKAKVVVSGNVFTITRRGVTVKIHNHAHNDAITGKNYLSLYVDVPAAVQQKFTKSFSGLCVSSDVSKAAIHGKSLFSTAPKVVKLPPQPPRTFTKKQTERATRACKKTGVKQALSLKNCVYDYLRATNKKEVLKAYTSDHKDNVALKKTDKKQNKKQKKFLKSKRNVRKLKRSLKRAGKRVARQNKRILNKCRRFLRKYRTKLSRAIAAKKNKKFVIIRKRCIVIVKRAVVRRINRCRVFLKNFSNPARRAAAARKSHKFVRHYNACAKTVVRANRRIARKQRRAARRAARRQRRAIRRVIKKQRKIAIKRAFKPKRRVPRIVRRCSAILRRYHKRR